jgi:hypothetical protein
MQTIIEKLRNLIDDNLITTGRDVFTFESSVSSKIFTLTEANISDSTIIVNKNGAIIPVINATWTRTGTIVTITKTAHGLINNDVITITISNVTAALPLGTYTITKLTADTFTVIGLNAGAASGTCTYNNYSYSTTTGKITITGNLTAGDLLEIDYSYYTKYSDTELQGIIRGAISYLVVEKYKTFAVKPPDMIFPTPTEAEENLIAVVASILIKGDVVSYRTPELTMTFERGDNKEKKIKKFVRQFKKTYGCLEYIDPSETIVTEEDEE